MQVSQTLPDAGKKQERTDWPSPPGPDSSPLTCSFLLISTAEKPIATERPSVLLWVARKPQWQGKVSELGMETEETKTLLWWKGLERKNVKNQGRLGIKLSQNKYSLYKIYT